MNEDYNQAAFDVIVNLYGGLPIRCDFCGQVFTDVRYPILEAAGELVCKECYVSRSCERSEAGQAPAELWMRPTPTGGYWCRPMLTPPDPDAVRYVRADLYEALQARLAVVRSWNEAPCLEPLGTDYPR